MEKWYDQDLRLAAYKGRNLTNSEAHDLIVRATDVGSCPNRLVPTVPRELREPCHQQFVDRSVWSLFNAFTESLKGRNLAELPLRTEALHGLLDARAGLHQRL